MSGAAGSSGGVEPTTVRQMLIWIYGLETGEQQSAKTALVDHIKNGIFGNDKITFSTNGGLQATNVTDKLDEVIKDAGEIIICIQKGEDCYKQDGKQKRKIPLTPMEWREGELDELKTEIPSVKYPVSGQDLYDKLFEYLNKCYRQLKFLYQRCRTNSQTGGWGQCSYGQNVDVDGNDCKDNAKTAHNTFCDTCTQKQNKRCLQAFLTDNDGGNTTGNVFKHNGKLPPMGFDKDKLPHSPKRGLDLESKVIRHYVYGDGKPFHKLLGFMKVISMAQVIKSDSNAFEASSLNWTLGDHFAFWIKFKDYWTKNTDDFKNKWTEAFNKHLQPDGQWHPKDQKPENILDELFKEASKDQNNHSAQNHNSLFTLMSCEPKNSDAQNSKCGKYLYSLFIDPFSSVFGEYRKFGNDSLSKLRTFEMLQQLAKEFKEALKKFQHDFNQLTCVTDSKDQCQCIVFCDNTHQLLYWNGFTFYSPDSLKNKTNRKCSDLKAQLEKVLSSNSPLTQLTTLRVQRWPKTVRQMLLWLYGLKDNSRSELKQKLTDHIKETYGSTAELKNVATTITSDLDKVLEESGKIVKSIQEGSQAQSVSHDEFKDEIGGLRYPDGGEELYNRLFEYLNKCFSQLRFLMLRCDTNSQVGGWGQCKYGQSVDVTGCQGDASKGQNHNNRCQHCSGTKKGCLQAFLVDEKTTKPWSTNTYYTNKDHYSIPPMGFKDTSLPRTSKTGKELRTALSDFLDDPSHTKAFPKLLGHIKILEVAYHTQAGSTGHTPLFSDWPLGDLFSFWQEFGERWTHKTDGQQFKSGWEAKFEDKVRTMNGSDDYVYGSNVVQPSQILTELFSTSHTTTHNSLYSLTSCTTGSTCSKYLYGLFRDPMHHVVNAFQRNGALKSQMTFDNLQSLATRFYDELKKFKEKFEKLTCVTPPNSCQCIVWCDDTHAELYRHGLTFNSPNELKSKDKQCSHLSQQLEAVLKKESPLEKFTNLGTRAKAQPSASPTSGVSQAGGSGGQLRSDGSSTVIMNANLTNPNVAVTLPVPLAASRARSSPPSSPPAASAAPSSSPPSTASKAAAVTTTTVYDVKGERIELQKLADNVYILPEGSKLHKSSAPRPSVPVLPSPRVETKVQNLGHRTDNLNSYAHVPSYSGRAAAFFAPVTYSNPKSPSSAPTPQCTALTTSPIKSCNYYFTTSHHTEPFIIPPHLFVSPTWNYNRSTTFCLKRFHSPMSIRQSIEFLYRFLEHLLCTKDPTSTQTDWINKLKAMFQGKGIDALFKDDALRSKLCKVLKDLKSFLGIKDCKVEDDLKSQLDKVKNEIKDCFTGLQNAFKALYTKTDKEYLEGRLKIFSVVKFSKEICDQKNADPEPLNASSLCKQIYDQVKGSIETLRNNHVIPYRISTELGIETFFNNYRNAFTNSNNTLTFNELHALFQSFYKLHNGTLVIGILFKELVKSTQMNDATQQSGFAVCHSNSFVHLVNGIATLSGAYGLMEKIQKKSATSCLDAQNRNGAKCLLGCIYQLYYKLGEFFQEIHTLNLNTLGNDSNNSLLCNLENELRTSNKNSSDSLRTRVFETLKKTMDKGVREALEAYDAAYKEYNDYSKRTQDITTKYNDAKKEYDKHKTETALYNRYIDHLNEVYSVHGPNYCKIKELFNDYFKHLLLIFNSGVISFCAELMGQLADLYLGLYALHYFKGALKTLDVSNWLTVQHTEGFLYGLKALNDHGFGDPSQLQSGSTPHSFDKFKKNIFSLHHLVQYRGVIDSLQKSPHFLGQLEFDGNGIIKGTETDKLRPLVHTLLCLKDDSCPSAISSTVFPFDFQLRHILWNYADKESIKRLNDMVSTLKEINRCLQHPDRVLYNFSSKDFIVSDPCFVSLVHNLGDLFTDRFVEGFCYTFDTVIMPSAFTHRIHKLHELYHLLKKIKESNNASLLNDQLVTLSSTLDSLSGLPSDINNLCSLVQFLQQHYVFHYSDLFCRDCLTECSTTDYEKWFQRLSKTFYMVIPIVNGVVSYLQPQCGRNPSWSSHRINDVSQPPGKFFKHCGYEPGTELESKPGTSIVSHSTSFSQSLDAMSKVILHLMSGSTDAFVNEFRLCVPSSSDSTIVSPTSFSELLIWIFFMPFGTDFKSVLQRLKEDYCLEFSSGSDVKDFLKMSNAFKLLHDFLCSIPMLFFCISSEAEKRATYGCHSLFRIIESVLGDSKSPMLPSYAEASICAKTLLSSLPVLHWGLEALKKDCNTKDAEALLTKLGLHYLNASEANFKGFLCDILSNHLGNVCDTKDGVMSRLRKELCSQWSNGNIHCSHNLLPATNANISFSTPLRLRHILLCLLCLPTSGAFHSLRRSVKREFESNTSGPHVNSSTLSLPCFVSSFVDLWLSVPALFWTLEQDTQKLLKDIYEYKGLCQTAIKTDSMMCVQTSDPTISDLFFGLCYVLYSIARFIKDLRCTNSAVGHKAVSDDSTISMSPDLFDKLCHLMGWHTGTHATITLETFHNALKDTFQLPDTECQCLFTNMDVTRCQCSNSSFALFPFRNLLRFTVSHFRGRLQDKSVQSVRDTDSTPPVKDRVLWVVGFTLSERFVDMFCKGQLSEVHLKEFKEKFNDSELQTVLKHITTSNFVSHFLSLTRSFVVLLCFIEGDMFSAVEFLTNCGKQDSVSLYPADCFRPLCDHLYNVFILLRFLSLQCSRDPVPTSWSHCVYNVNVTHQNSDDSVCHVPFRCDCPNSQGRCNDANCSKPLRGFLTGQVTTKKETECELTGLGFKEFNTDCVPQGAAPFDLTGSDIYDVLCLVIDPLVDTTPEKDSSLLFHRPLSRLLQYCVAISHRPAHSLGDLFELASQLSGIMWKRGKEEYRLDDKLTSELGSVFTGDNTRDAEQETDSLKKSFGMLFPQSHTTSKPPDLHTALSSVTMGNVTQCISDRHQCAPYMFSLSSGLWSLYVPVFQSKTSSTFPVLQWLYDQLRELFVELREFKDALSSGHNAHYGALTSCPSTDISECCVTFTVMYTNGFAMKDKVDRKCTDFVEQLKRIMAPYTSVLYNVLQTIVSVVHKIMLHRAVGAVECAINKNSNDQKDASLTPNDAELERIFKRYVTDAITASMLRMLCVFLCRLFGVEGCTEHVYKAKDRHYEGFTIATTYPYNHFKASVTLSPRGLLDPYQFDVGHSTDPKDLINSLKHALKIPTSCQQFLCPPLNLRHSLDFILRLTEGELRKDCSNDRIGALSSAVSTLLRSCNVDAPDLKHSLSHLVKGVRTFLGLKDVEEELKKEVEEKLEEKKDVLQKDYLNKLGTFLSDSKTFSSKLGDTLQRAFCEVVDSDKKHVLQVSQDLCTILATSHRHSNCTFGTSCRMDFKPSSTSGATSLETLIGLFGELVNLHNQRLELQHRTIISVIEHISVRIVEALEFESEPLGPGFFDRFHRVVKSLSACLTQLKRLEEHSNGNSSQYRKKITALVGILQRSVRLVTDEGQKKILGASATLSHVMHKEAELYIRNSMRQQIERNCYDDNNDRFVIPKILEPVDSIVSSHVMNFKSHLTDLKDMCAWLLRFGAVFHGGLWSFVLALCEHLQHIETMIQRLEEVYDKVKELDTDPRSGNHMENFSQALDSVHKLMEYKYYMDQGQQTFLSNMLPVISDRYVIEQWHYVTGSSSDGPTPLTGWSIFAGDGIIRPSGRETIRKALSTLTGVPVFRIYDFHVAFILQKFSYSFPLESLMSSIASLKRVSGLLKEFVKVQSSADSKSNMLPQQLCALLDKFIVDPHGIYALSRALMFALGPNRFSVFFSKLGQAYRELTDQNASLSRQHMSTLTALVNGVNITEQNETYSIDHFVTQLESLLSFLGEQYIFSYPVGPKFSLKESLQCPDGLLLRCDSQCDISFGSSLCSHCVPVLARMFVTIVPMSFPQLLYLDFQCQKYWTTYPVRPLDAHRTLFSDKKALLTLFDTFGYESKDLRVGSHGVYLVGSDVHDFLKDLDLLKDSKTSTTMPFNASPLYELYRHCVHYFQRKRLQRNPKSSFRPPSTLRDIIKVTAFLPFSPQFDDLLEHLQRLSQPHSPVCYSDLYCVLLVSSSFSAQFLQVIEQPMENYLCFYESLFTNDECLMLPEDITMLLHHLSDLCVTLYRGLRFLCLQCSLEAKFGGWRQCEIGSDSKHNATAVFTDHRCYCDPSQPRSFLPLSGISVTCSHPLYRYLTDHPDYFNVNYNVYHSLRNICMDAICKKPVYTHMAKRGWQKENLLPKSATLASCHYTYPSALTGYDIFRFLKSLVGHFGPDPLLKLTRYLVHITLRPPDSISSYMAFMLSYSQGMDADDSKHSDLSSTLRKEIYKFPGTFEATCYTKALTEISKCNSKHSSKDPPCCNTLLCLSQCRGFLSPLESEAYNLFDAKYSRHYLTWTVHFGKRLWRGLEQLKKDFGLHYSTCNAPSIVMCPFALPYLHSSGFHYRDPKHLCESNVTCSKLVTCLEGVLKSYTSEAPDSASVFYKFLTQVDRFLWSIRHPFACTMLALWLLNILYLCYVHLWRLDLLHLLSHGIRNRHSFMVSPLVIFAVPTGTDVVTYVQY